MQRLVWFLIVALIALRQAPWFWEDRTLLFGFLPVGLAFQMAVSVAAAGTWLLAVRCAWPATLEAAAGTDDSPEGGAAR